MDDNVIVIININGKKFEVIVFVKVKVIDKKVIIKGKFDFDMMLFDFFGFKLDFVMEVEVVK